MVVALDAYVPVADEASATERALAGRLPALGEALLPTCLVVTVSLAPIFGDDPLRGGGRAIFLALVALSLLALALRRPASVRLGLALVATISSFALPWQLCWWPLPGVVGLGVYLLAKPVCAEAAGHAAPWWWLGRLSRSEFAAIAGLVAVAGSALLIFHGLTPPALGLGVRLIGPLPAWSVVVGGLAFVTVNAAVEEVFFRAVILGHLRAAIGTRPALLVQAVGFGLLNLHGYPYGLVGVALTSVYGLMLGVLRLRSGGLLAGWIAHVAADSVIFLFILQAAGAATRST